MSSLLENLTQSNSDFYFLYYTIRFLSCKSKVPAKESLSPNLSIVCFQLLHMNFLRWWATSTSWQSQILHEQEVRRLKLLSWTKGPCLFSDPSRPHSLKLKFHPKQPLLHPSGLDSDPKTIFSCRYFPHSVNRSLQYTYMHYACTGAVSSFK